MIYALVTLLLLVGVFFHILHTTSPKIVPSSMEGYYMIQLAGKFLDGYQFQKFLGDPKSEILIFWDSTQAEYYGNIELSLATDYLEKLKKVLPLCYYHKNDKFEYLTLEED